MSEFWKKFKGIFIEEDPKAQKGKVQETPQSKPNPTPQTSPNVVVQMPVTEGGKLQERFMQALFDAMGKANMQGFDYFEYKQAIANLQNMPMDEATRYKSAFAMAQTMGASADKLIESAIYYLDILKQEDSKFQSAVANQRKTQVGDKESMIANLEAVVKQKSEMIKKLTDEIEQHQKEMTQAKSEIEGALIKVTQTKQDFDATYQYLVGLIQKDVNNMKQYLK